jgi:hypothetical protein
VRPMWAPQTPQNARQLSQPPRRQGLHRLWY